MDISEILQKARRSISNFCMTECNAYCCRQGLLSMSVDEFPVIVTDKKSLFEDSGMYYLRLKGGCPRLEGNVCTIHRLKKRPNVCKDYPIFFRKGKIIISSNCLAVKMNMLYPYIHKIKKMGYEVVERD
ncbi:MAG: YkgJ family cysteine cluster protein [Candidatus Woesearchaeota archaeon]